MNIRLGVLVMVAACWALLISFITMAREMYLIAAIFMAFCLIIVVLMDNVESETDDDSQ